MSDWNAGELALPRWVEDLETVVDAAGIDRPMALLGISFGFSSTLEGAMWPEIYGTTHLGAIRSIVVAAAVLSSALGPGLTGYLIDAGVDYPLQLAAMGVYSLAAAFIMWRVSRKLAGRALHDHGGA